MSLDADLSLRLGDLDLRARLAVPDGSVTAVLGPNGSGKTTLLRTLAGLLATASGHVTLDGTVLDDPAAGRFVVPEERRVGVVFQDYLLFPHLTATDNVAFGPRSRGASRVEARAAAVTWLGRMGLADHAGARPRHLSGGQAQRVALARALATEPRLLLLDEPLAALDAGTRVEVRRDLRRHLGAFDGATVLVTHDPLDALALADRVVVLERGRISQAGPIAEVTARPRSDYVARLIGTNLLRGTAAGGAIAVEGTTLTAAGEHEGPVFATVAPHAIALHRDPPGGSPRNRWRDRVQAVDLLGDRLRVRLEGPPGLVAEITPAAAAELGLRDGVEVWASVKATEIEVYPA
jgi:molybdate transport system ATP-binding protein